MTRALIIGYGRAGRRHGAALDRAGVEWAVVEPRPRSGSINWLCSWVDLDAFLETKIKDTFDFAVICTPPKLHLEQIRRCLDAGLPVLCEKPLCGLGELGEAERLLKYPRADRVMLAFNYRFHPALMVLNLARQDWIGNPGNWAAFSDQYRPDIPEWGLLLDHVSHSIDLLLWLSRVEHVWVRRASYHTNDASENWFIDGEVDGRRFNVWEGVRQEPVKKRAWVSGPFGNVEVATPPEIVDRMMDSMYYEFLSYLRENRPFPVGLTEGLMVQWVLEAANDKTEVTE